MDDEPNRPNRSWVQRLILGVVSSDTAASIEAESRAWKMICPSCNAKRSVWDAGGLRWKAKGNPRVMARCSACGAKAMHRLEYESHAGR